MDQSPVMPRKVIAAWCARAGEHEREREGATPTVRADEELGPGDAHATRLEPEGDEARALAPLGRHGEDADDRQDERHRHRRGLEVLAEGVLAALVEEHDRQRDRDDRADADQQPAAGAGVEHLAQLDVDETAEGHAGRGARAGDAARHLGARVGRADSAFLETGPVGVRRSSWSWCGHAATSSRAESAVRSRNISSRPRLSAPRSSVRTIWWATATRPTTMGSASTCRPPVGVRCATIDGLGERGHECVVVGGAGERAGAGEQLVLGALGDDRAVADDDDVVGDALDLVQQVRATAAPCRPRWRSRAAGRASSGCRPGRARWPARRG